MEVTSLVFLALSVLSVFIYYNIDHKYRILFLAILSCLFILSFSHILLLYVLIYSGFNFWIGKKIKTSEKSRFLFLSGIIINLLQLVLLKYTSFTFNPIFELFNIKFDFSFIADYIIPVGVSFFTLQGIGYLINVRMGWEKPEKNFLHFLLYISFYPRFLSGPVERSNHFLPQLSQVKHFNEKTITEGFRLILFGLFKKLVIANRLGEIVNGFYSDMNSIGEYSIWIVLLVQPLYLYYDFSGYTDIAIGLARAFGIELLQNFNRPFLAENVTTFWKRFHISLAAWFHDYVFIRTMFKTRKWRNNSTVIALFVTWIMFGIWHGAGWNFMLLGLIQGIAIYYEYLTKNWRINVFSGFPVFLRKSMGRALTYLFYAFSLVFFFSPDLSSTITFFSGLSHFNGTIPGDSDILILLFAILLALLLQFLEFASVELKGIYGNMESVWIKDKSVNILFRWSSYCAILALILFLGYGGEGFVYFQF